MVLHVALLEDQPMDMRDTQELVENLARDLQITAEFRNFTNGKDINPEDIVWADLFFLDIEIPGENGMDTARRIRTVTERTPIVFTTNYQTYTIEGYKVQAFRYLLKPIPADECRDCLAHAAELARTKAQDMLVLEQKSKKLMIKCDDIIFVEAAEHYCNVHTKQGKIKFRKRFSDIVEELQTEQFLQCHRSFIVNRYCICAWENQSLVMSNSKKIPISRSCTEAVKEALTGL